MLGPTGYFADGRCPRAVVVTLGNLLTSKLAFGALVGPAWAVLIARPEYLAAKIWFLKTFCSIWMLPNKANTAVSLEIDTGQSRMVLVHVAHLPD